MIARFVQAVQKTYAEDVTEGNELHDAVIERTRMNMHGNQFRICSNVQTSNGHRLKIRAGEHTSCQVLLEAVPTDLCGVAARIEESEMDGHEEVTVYVSHMQHVWKQCNSAFSIRAITCLLHFLCGLLCCISVAFILDMNLDPLTQFVQLAPNLTFKW